MNITKFIVENVKDSMRVDLYLLNLHPELSRTSAKKIIIEELLTVNGQKIMPNFRVKNGDIIELFPEKINELFNTQSLTQIKPVSMKLDFIYEDENTIILNKKSGVVVHPVYAHSDDTLMNGLAFYAIKYNKNNANKIRIRPVHRLDKDTSGVILFSKNKEAHEYYSKLFEGFKIQKTYVAGVAGNFKNYLSVQGQKKLSITSFLGRSDKTSKKVEIKKEGENAITEFEFYKECKNPKWSLVYAMPKTGKTHQIRVHLLSLEFPIVGDPLYSNIEYSRLMLHAYKLKLKIFGEEIEREFIAPLPKEFEEI